MKNAVLTVRLPAATRRRVEDRARREGRSLSQLVERLIEAGLAPRPPDRAAPRARSLAGALRGGRVPTLADFQAIRGLVSRALDRRTRIDADVRR